MLINSIKILIFSFLLISCKEGIEEKKIDSNKIKESIILYLDSTRQNIINLNSIFLNIKEPAQNYNRITVDSIFLNNKKHFIILLEHPIPIFNLFAVLDDSLNLLLRDNSINGYLNYSKLSFEANEYIQLYENFKSLDVFNIKRLSLYKKFGNQINLIFRGIVHFTSPKDSLIRNLTSITDSVIICSIPVSRNLIKKEIIYKYDFNNYTKRFNTVNDFMDSLVIKEINFSTFEFSSNQILNKKSYFDLLNERIKDSNLLEKLEYEFHIPDDWAKIDNISFHKILKKKIKGDYFINKRLGVNIGIIKIPELDNSEDYLNAEFTIQKQLRDYRIRETIVHEDIKYFYKAIEHYCSGKKYIIIIEGSKNIFRKNEEYFRNILSSFAINCE